MFSNGAVSMNEYRAWVAQLWDFPPLPPAQAAHRQKVLKLADAWRGSYKTVRRIA